MAFEEHVRQGCDTCSQEVRSFTLLPRRSRLHSRGNLERNWMPVPVDDFARESGRRKPGRLTGRAPPPHRGARLWAALEKKYPCPKRLRKVAFTIKINAGRKKCDPCFLPSILAVRFVVCFPLLCGACFSPGGGFYPTA
jgi:hypothetical protein